MALASVAASTSQSVGTSVVTLGPYTTAGTYQIRLNLTNLALGDEFEFVETIKIGGSGETAVPWITTRFFNAQSPKAVETVPLPSLWSITYTLQKIAGTDRVIPYDVMTL